ncbi:hypothetical protein J5295_09345 [Riemerella anatipestifer]|uniref:DoxX family protein n=1 Tax=Riemerella anatipestifer (strain ATCC 11845 / DSM 15868 / JCM 9532 / NCTC 11014) TaxID=693978 RepID=E4TAV1_RIEAD|nr:hypothetical protein [Riemerella anatipestifer]ADQ81187.1 hypothetical protein Riean_0005 [Riemerella anatipestifer ATCC 11845 = DSM 15868]ADZ11326.1 hypothetical protein RIA_0139 [Riemerella anatipestifer RA-GD]AFD55219.1 hypothetical protein RA0C_0208 [Riemerella anatipestifer ATCC 11845 = DSM 15868]AGC40928.1 hypothetical protein G148_1624 [Riemerella anatipestifer RA-CH-2]AKP68497.1 hypothetical protein CG08_0005 [Riemerella anatipestifer]
MEDRNYFNDEPKKTNSFYIAIGILAIFTLMGLGIDIDEFSQHESINIPTWYFYLIFGVDLLALVGLFLIVLFRKIGVFLFPLAVIAHFILHQFYLSTFLYTDVTNLFLYVGLGLLMIIPKWQYFK